MNDELHQIEKTTFDRIVFGLIALSLVVGLPILLTTGPASPWFIRVLALFVIAGVAYTLRLLGHLAIASYVLVLQLVGLVAEMLMQTSVIDSFIPYLFIPIVIIASLLLTPLASLIITLFLIVVSFLLILFTGQHSLNEVQFLLPTYGLTLLVALLAASNKWHLIFLGDRLVENRLLLRERALELMQAQRRMGVVNQEMVALERKLEDAEVEITALQFSVTENNRVHRLFDGTIEELKAAVAHLEQSIEQLSDMPKLNGQSDVLEAAWQKLYQLKSLVVNLEDMVQIGRDGFQLDYDQVDVNQLIDEIAGTAQGLVREKPIEVRTHYLEDAPLLKADPSRLRQVLLHLINNAARYTDRGHIEIRAELDDSQLIVLVSDTGFGMSGKEANRIFDVFKRGRDGAVRERQGAGLGLAISKRLVELHGGRMWVTSVKDEGSTFYLSLPLEVVRRAARPRVITGKTTLRLQKSILSDADLDFLSSEEKPSEESSLADGDTMILPQPVPRETTDQGQTASRKTLPIDPPPPITPIEKQEITRLLAKPSSVQSRHATQPIHRYQPVYIQRFGFILLGILFFVLAAVATLAALNYGRAEPQPAAGVAKLASPTQPATVMSQVDADLTVGQSSPTLADEIAPILTATPESSPLLAPLPTDTPLPSPTHTFTPLPPTPTPQPPTTTPTPTASTTVSPTGLPSSTPAPIPPTATTTIITVPVAANPAQLVFAGLREDAIPVQQNGNSRVSWSPSGQVLFANGQGNGRNIFVTGGAGAAPVNLTNSAADDIQPVWSPDGRTIAFSSGRTGNFDIFVMDADGSNPIQLTTSLGFDEWPAWSTDGRRLAFVSDWEGNVEIYTMNADGSNQQRLTNHPADDWPAAWSPDDRWLVFASNRDADWNLYVISSSGGPAQRLTNAPGTERDPVWSPDGASIAFAYNSGSGWDVYTLPVPLGAITEVPFSRWTQVTNTPTDERYPTWAQISSAR